MDIDWESVWGSTKDFITRWVRRLLSVGRLLGTAALAAFLIHVAGLMMGDGFGMDAEPLVRMTFLAMSASIAFGIELGRRMYGPKPPKQ